MPGLKQYYPDFQMPATRNRVTPDEIDQYRNYHVVYPSTSVSWFGTAAAGTAGQAKALVVLRRNSDAVAGRNLAGIVLGSSDMGGTWTVNGKDQFGVSISETITVGTAANGGTTAGTKVFAQVSSGTVTFATAALGNGTATLGVDTIGTTVLFGLPDKIASTADVKAISWTTEFTATTINGGTVGAYVQTATHSFRGTANVAGTQTYQVMYRPTLSLEASNNQAAL